jgi:hypothetical protein
MELVLSEAKAKRLKQSQVNKVETASLSEAARSDNFLGGSAAAYKRSGAISGQQGGDCFAKDRLAVTVS